MAVAKKTIQKDQPIAVVDVSQGDATFRILGTTPLIMESFSTKARQELLMPAKPMNRTERTTRLKHPVYDEFEEAAYTADDGPTYLAMPAAAFKRAVATAALDMSGVSKAEIGRLTRALGEYVPIWGIPRLIMSMVRSSGINAAPDVRSRPIIWPWATEITFRYTLPKMNDVVLARLLVGAGVTCGVGGWRQEKGSGSYGLFKVAAPDDEPEFRSLVETAGRVAQEEAMRSPSAYDNETAKLLAWYDDEIARRKRDGVGAV